MKFDWDIAREILKTIEEFPKPYGMPDYSLIHQDKSIIADHLDKLLNQGLIQATPHRSLDEPTTFLNPKLTIDGQNLLNKISDDTVWNKVKQFAIDAGKTLTTEAILKLVTQA